MKRLVICMILLLGIFSFVSAQEMKFSEMTANIGKGAFTSGFDITLKFKAQGNLLEITGNHERGYVVYTWDLPLTIKAGISGGAFKNMFWAGPYVLATPTKFLSLLYWSGWGAGKPNKPETRIRDLFQSGGIFLTIEKFNFSYIVMTFLGEKTAIPGISYTVALNKTFKFFVGVDYKTSEKIPLFRIGISHFPANN